jgi:hypothetical protein
MAWVSGSFNSSGSVWATSPRPQGSGGIDKPLPDNLARPELNQLGNEFSGGKKSTDSKRRTLITFPLY